MNAVRYKYLFGTGVRVDAVKAVHWFCLAIGQGNPRAMNNLAQMLGSGRYGMRDEAEARRLWEQSPKPGHANSRKDLGTAELRGTRRDPSKGEGLMNPAAKPRPPHAQS